MQSPALPEVQESVQSDAEVRITWGCAAILNPDVCRWVFDVKIPELMRINRPKPVTEEQAAAFESFIEWILLSIAVSCTLCFLYNVVSRLAHYYRTRRNAPYEELSAVRKKLKTTEAAYKNLLSEHESCLPQISAAEDAYSALSSRHQELTASFAELKRRLDEEKSKRAELKKVHQLELQEADEVESRRRMENLAKKLKKKVGSEEKLGLVVAELQPFKVKASGVIDEQKAKLRRRNAMIESLKASVESNESVIHQARQDMLRYKLQRDKAMDEVRHKEDKLSSLLSSVRQSDEITSRLSNRVAFLEALNSQLECELNKLAKVNCGLLKGVKNGGNI